MVTSKPTRPQEASLPDGHRAKGIEPSVPRWHSRDAVTSRLRLRGYDYSLPGNYFVTICVNQQKCLFGHIEDDEMILSTSGLMIDSWWHGIALEFPTVRLDAVVVMPNHIHGIVELTASEDADGTRDGPNLSKVISWFKSITTHDYLLGVRIDDWPRFPGRLWQPRFHEHIVRDDRALDRIRNYIAANPSQWHRDPENPIR